MNSKNIVKICSTSITFREMQVQDLSSGPQFRTFCNSHKPENNPNIPHQVNRQTSCGCIQMLECCSLTKRNKLLLQLIHVTTWMDLKIIMLCERNFPSPQKGYILYDSSYIQVWKIQTNFKAEKANQQLPGNGAKWGGAKGRNYKGAGGDSGNSGMCSLYCRL